MKIEVIDPPVPKKTVILTLTEEEAGLIQWFAFYYATRTDTASTACVPSARLSEELGLYRPAPVYPYSSAFQKSDK